jgi:tetratricopeptide (TPR) repeat protein
MVVGRPGGDLNRQGLEIVCSAIELLLESADVQAANDLYQHRLRNGNLFLNLGAPQLGFEIAAGFLRNQTYRDSIKSVLGEAALSFYLNDGALFATLAGEPHLARRWYEEKIELNRQSGGGDALSVGLQNLGEVLMHQGDLTGALAAFAESAGATGHVHWSLRARILELQAALFLGETGRVGDALRQIPKEHSIGKAYFHTVWLVMCDYHLKLGDVAAAKELSIPDLMPPNNVVDRCMCGLTNAALQYALGQYQNAANSLAAVERESTNGHVVYYLASTLLLQGRVLAESDGTREEARAKCERALGLAAPRGYRLIQCGALLMLATLARRDDESLTVARDQAEAALYLARDCKYVWGEMSANRVLVEVLKSLRDLSQSALAMKRYTALAQRLGYKGASGLVI